MSSISAPAPSTGCPEGLSQSVGRRLAYAAAELYMQMDLPPDETNRQALQAALGRIPIQGPDSPNLKYHRYILGSREIGRGMAHVITDDGYEASFANWTPAGESCLDTPYRQFRVDVETTFERGWDEFEATIPVAELTYMRERYHEVLQQDPSSKITGKPIDENDFRIGVELGPELTSFGILFGIARAKHSKLQHADAEEVLAVARDLHTSLNRRGRMQLKNIFRGWMSYVNLNVREVEITQLPNGKYIFTQGGGREAFYYPSIDHLPEHPVVHCMADLVRIRPTDKHPAMENGIFAGIKQLHATGLLEPDVASETWELRLAAEKAMQPEIVALKHQHRHSDPDTVARIIGNHRHSRVLSFM
jgi:hypothetical protein